MRNVLAVIPFLLLIPAVTHAQISSNFGGAQGGAVIVGASTTTCDGAIEGAIRYESASKKIQFCGQQASDPTGCPSIGDSCSDGSVYAGLSPDGNVNMYTTPADEGGFPWNNGNTLNQVTTGQTSTVTGETNTANLIATDSDSGTGGTQPHQAAQTCADLSAHGRTDWYLPAQDELNVLYINKAAIGGFNTGGSFPAGYYWSSTEIDNDSARPQRFSNGVASNITKNTGASVRCTRQGITYSWVDF